MSSALADVGSAYMSDRLEVEAGFVEEDDVSVGPALQTKPTSILLPQAHRLSTVVTLVIDMDPLERHVSTIIQRPPNGLMRQTSNNITESITQFIP